MSNNKYFFFHKLISYYIILSLTILISNCYDSKENYSHFQKHQKIVENKLLFFNERFNC